MIYSFYLDSEGNIFFPKIYNIHMISSYKLVY